MSTADSGMEKPVLEGGMRRAAMPTHADMALHASTVTLLAVVGHSFEPQHHMEPPTSRRQHGGRWLSPDEVKDRSTKVAHS